MFLSILIFISVSAQEDVFFNTIADRNDELHRLIKEIGEELTLLERNENLNKQKIFELKKKIGKLNDEYRLLIGFEQRLITGSEYMESSPDIVKIKLDEVSLTVDELQRYDKNDLEKRINALGGHENRYRRQKLILERGDMHFKLSLLQNKKSAFEAIMSGGTNASIEDDVAIILRTRTKDFSAFRDILEKTGHSTNRSGFIVNPFFNTTDSDMKPNIKPISGKRQTNRIKRVVQIGSSFPDPITLKEGKIPFVRTTKMYPGDELKYPKVIDILPKDIQWINNKLTKPVSPCLTKMGKTGAIVVIPLSVATDVAVNVAWRATEQYKNSIDTNAIINSIGTIEFSQRKIEKCLASSLRDEEFSELFEFSEECIRLIENHEILLNGLKNKLPKKERSMIDVIVQNAQDSLENALFGPAAGIGEKIGGKIKDKILNIIPSDIFINALIPDTSFTQWLQKWMYGKNVLLHDEPPSE